MELEEHNRWSKRPSGDEHRLEWRTSSDPIPYLEAKAFMEERVAEIRSHHSPELIWCLEHPPIVTGGTSARLADLLEPDRFPVFDAGRGGQYTYHGPGQRVIYCLLDLRKRGRDLRQFVSRLETWMIAVLGELGIVGERRAGRVGIWVQTDDGEAKIGAIGVRVRHWISFHGLSLNIDPDLSHFDAIVPCGIQEHGVTSLAALGVHVRPSEIDRLFHSHFGNVFDAC